MKSSEGPGVAKSVSRRGHARERVLEAARDLFANQGVHGTSLQMIADWLGITKASVYYQFQSKDDIVVAVVQPVFDDIVRLVRIAEAMSSPQARRETAVSGLVEFSVRHRRLTAAFYGDPAIESLVRSHPDFENAINGLRALLTGPDPSTSGRVATSMITAGIYGTATDPRLRDVSDAELHRILLDSAQRLLQVGASVTTQFAPTE
jgi:AcrR family transcriptional regulator